MTKKKLTDIITKYEAKAKAKSNAWPEEAVFLAMELHKRRVGPTMISRALAEIGIKKSPDTIKAKIKAELHK